MHREVKKNLIPAGVSTGHGCSRLKYLDQRMALQFDVQSLHAEIVDLAAIHFAPPSPTCVRSSAGEHDSHFDEGAVMVAYAMHLLRMEKIDEVRIHPNGEYVVLSISTSEEVTIYGLSLPDPLDVLGLRTGGRCIVRRAARDCSR